jgi:hypothetical protein
MRFQRRSAQVRLEEGTMSHTQTSTRVAFGVAADGGDARPGPPPLAEALAVEIVIAWGHSALLHVAHLAPARSFYLGEAGENADAHEPATDFSLDVSALGVRRLPLILEDAGQVSVVIPAGAELEAELEGVLQTLPVLQERGLLTPAVSVDKAQLYSLPPGGRVRVAYLGLSFYVQHTQAASVPRRVVAPRSVLKQNLWQLVSFGVHGLLLGAFYCMPPTASALSLDQLNVDDRFIRYHVTPPAAQVEERPSWLHAEAGGGSPGRAAQGDSGKMGDPSNTAQKRRHAEPGSSTQPKLAAPERLTPDAVREEGILGILHGNLPTQLARFDRERAEGSDPDRALGELLGLNAGASNGNGGLGMIGSGRGGGGDGEGTIGTGPLGTIGTHSGSGKGGPFGDGVGPGLRPHVARVPKIHPSTPEVFGSLSKEAIRRVIGRHLNEVRYCYQQRLVSRPDLQGRVAVRFMIGMSGAVQLSVVTSSDVGDVQVGTCIADAVKRWDFPAPEGGGSVIVNYPFVLAQAGD